MSPDEDDFALPRESIDWLSRPIGRFLQLETAAGAILLLFAIAALLISNSPWGQPFLKAWEVPLGLRLGAFEFTRSLHDWINDALMTLFFFLVALELKRELVLGELRKPRTAMLSIMAALGGMLVPALFYLSLMRGHPGEEGWGTVMATDTAFVIGCLAILGKRIPQELRVFMLSLAIVDDIGAILIVAIGYGNEVLWGMLALALLGLGVVHGMHKLGIRSLAAYGLAGTLIWLAVDASGLHATVTGVILGLMAPARPWVSDQRMHSILHRVSSHPPGDHWSGDTDNRKALRLAETATRETLSPLERLEIKLHPWVAFLIMPLFAFANAGVPMSLADAGGPVTLAILVGFVLGKPIGILSFSWLAVRVGIARRPRGLSWGLLAAACPLGGIGFTMAIFIANLGFKAELVNAAKLGILSASICSALLGVASLSCWSAKTHRSKY